MYPNILKYQWKLKKDHRDDRCNRSIIYGTAGIIIGGIGTWQMVFNIRICIL